MQSPPVLNRSNNNNIKKNEGQSTISFDCIPVTFTEEQIQNAILYQRMKAETLRTQTGDGRSKVEKISEDSFCASVGQLIASFPVPKYEGTTEAYVGTGCIIDCPQGRKILTCAHNVFHYNNWTESKIHMIGGIFYPGYIKSKNHKPYTCTITKVTIYPRYFQPDKTTIYSGDDLAILDFAIDPTVEKFPIATDALFGYFESSDLNQRLPLKVYGYPGEKEKSGDPYEMDGTIFKVTYNDDKGGLLIYTDIDTSAGQSGSPVLVWRDNVWILIGVHVGGDTGCNMATLLSEKIFNWIFDSFNM